MKTPQQRGYLWNFYGYTKLHLWGCYLTGGVLSLCGTVLLVGPALLWSELPDRIFLRLLLLSIACFAAATSVAAGSIFTLVFFRGPGGQTSDGAPTSAESSQDRNAEPR